MLMLTYVSGSAALCKLIVKLRGVYDFKISLTPFDGVRFALPLTVAAIDWLAPVLYCKSKKIIMKRALMQTLPSLTVGSPKRMII